MNRIHAEIVEKAQLLGSPCEIFQFLNQKIRYYFYKGSKYSEIDVLRDKRGNCLDIARLLIAMLKSIDIDAKLIYTTTPYKRGLLHHYNVSAKINGRTIIVDVVSDNPLNRHKGAWVRGLSC